MYSLQRLLKTVPRAVALAAAGLSLSACAYVSQHPDGSANVLGLAAVSMHQTPGAPPGHVTVRSHGVTLSDKPPAQGLVLGVYDQPMQFGQPAPQPVTYAPPGPHGNVDFVGRTRAMKGEPVYDDYRPYKHKKYRKRKSCRCR
jgi:hypothetical protein